MATSPIQLSVIVGGLDAYTSGLVGQDSSSGADPIRDAAHAPTTPSGSDVGAPGQLGPSSVLADRYRLVRRIGTGGMGSVWEAEHLALASTLAIKLINPALLNDERARSRFLGEARAAATLRSPHVVQIFDYGVHDGTPFIAMELLVGEPLSDRLTRKRRLPPADVLELVTQVGRAVAKAHESGVVHRDLKPDNIYIVAGEHGEVFKVLDFGIAKRSVGAALDSTTKTGGMLGTPFYMSPEQLVDAGRADARADLWSLAVITYECLLGRRPFAAETMPELAVAVLAEPVPVPSQSGVVPAGFDAWFARATRRDPDERYQGVGEMIDALAECLRPGSGASVTAVGVEGHPSSVRRSSVWLVATVVGAATLAGIALTSGDDPSDAEPAPATVPVTAAPAETREPAPKSNAKPEAVVPPAKAPPSEPTSAGSTSPNAHERAAASDDPRRPTKKPRERPASDRPAETKHDLDELEP